MKKQVIAVSLVLLAIVSVSIAGVAVAQPWNATTTHATPRSSTASSSSTTASDTSSCCCTCKGEPALGGPVFRGVHGEVRDIAQGCATASSRQQVKSWYEQLPQDQKTALQDKLQQARESWYQQLPQDQKDKLATILDKLPQDERSRVKDEFGIQ